MAAKQTGISYKDILAEVKAGTFRPIYFLYGPEPYYIDRVAEYITSQALRDDERDFNETILYGLETSPHDVVELARRYPMMAERQVVVVRECQLMRQGNKSLLQAPEALIHYAQNPQPSTVLILCFKSKLEGGAKLLNAIRQHGIAYESGLLRDYQLPPFINDYVRRKGRDIAPDATMLLAEHIGANLGRLAADIDKIILSLRDDETRITSSHVEHLVGMSKEYSVFELINALSVKDVNRAGKIVKYYDNNPKNFTIQLVLTQLHKFYADLLLAAYAPSQAEGDLSALLKQSAWQLRQSLIPALRHYSKRQIFDILGEIRKTDAASKGVGVSLGTDGDLLKELVFRILH